MKKKQVKSKKTNIVLLVLGLLLVVGAIVYLVLNFSNKEPASNNKPTENKKDPEVEYEIKHDVKKVTVKSQSEEYNTNLVDITVKMDDKNIEYIYVSNTGFGVDEARYFYGELIFDWKVAETQDGKEHTIYITAVDKEGNVGRESVTYKVDAR